MLKHTPQDWVDDDGFTETYGAKDTVYLQGKKHMISRTLQEWVDFTGLYGALDVSGDVHLHYSKPTLDEHGFWEEEDGKSIDITIVVANIIEIDSRKLYTPTHVMQRGDRVLCWQNDWHKDTFPETKYYLVCEENKFVATDVPDDTTGHAYHQCILFDKDLAGLTIGELECRLGENR